MSQKIPTIPDASQDVKHPCNEQRCRECKGKNIIGGSSGGSSNRDLDHNQNAVGEGINSARSSQVNLMKLVITVCYS